MTIFVDTSAIVAAMNAGDIHQGAAIRAWGGFLEAKTPMITTNYVIVESLAVAQGRLGFAAVRALLEEIFPLLRLEWIEEGAHRSAAAALLATNRRSVGLVDLTSFETMRRLGIRTAFAFDHHFTEYGFETVPHPARGRS